MDKVGNDKAEAQCRLCSRVLAYVGGLKMCLASHSSELHCWALQSCCYALPSWTHTASSARKLPRMHACTRLNIHGCTASVDQRWYNHVIIRESALTDFYKPATGFAAETGFNIPNAAAVTDLHKTSTYDVHVYSELL